MNDMNDNQTNDQSNGEPWEGEMSTEFDRRVRDLHEAPLSLDQVKGKAVTIQRKRRAAVAGGILAAAAVIVPVAVAAGGNPLGDSRGDEIPAATSTPSPTAVDSETPSAPGTPDAPTAATFGYIEGTTFHHPDGTISTLPEQGYRDAADLGDVVAAYRDTDGYGFVDLLDGEEVTETYEIRGPMTTAPDGLTVAFVTTDDELLFVNGEHGEQSFGEIDPGATLSAIVGDGDCVQESGCHPFFRWETKSADAFEINYEGPNSTPAPGAQVVNDADGFLVAVRTSSTDYSTCGLLYDREGGGQEIFETCDYQVDEISPDGQHVIGLPSYFDGLGPRWFTILDRTGTAVVPQSDEGVGEFDTAYVAQAGWLDASTAVATVYTKGVWQIVSVGVDGTRTVLAESTEGDEIDAPFFLTGLG